MTRTIQSLFALPLAIALVYASFTPHLEAASRFKAAGEAATSADDLRSAYEVAKAGGEKVRILIMPGHEPDFGGAEFLGYYEREFVVDIAQKLQTELAQDPNLEVLVARGALGWNSDFARYFDREMEDIEEFVDEHKEAFEKAERRGNVPEKEDQMSHNDARPDVAQRLYGVTKWANENDVDLVLHLHINDEAGRGAEERGTHQGVAIYVPEDIFGNAEATRAVAEPIFEKLTTTNATSTFGLETKGILESRDLIAVGAFNTSAVPSMLIEYGYIYEPRITGHGARESLFRDFAYQTAEGVRSFFGTPSTSRFVSRALPATFSTDLLAAGIATSSSIATSTLPAPDANQVYALQATLYELGFYPHASTTLVACPLDGIKSTCVTDAVKDFQKAKGLEQTGTLGPRTRALLNSAFTPQPVPVSSTASTTSSTTTLSCTPFTRTLVVGSTDQTTGGEVSRLQHILSQDVAWYPERLVTGYLGNATIAAVQRFQVAQNLAQPSTSGYGLIGPRTKEALVAACKAP